MEDIIQEQDQIDLKHSKVSRDQRRVIQKHKLKTAPTREGQNIEKTHNKFTLSQKLAARERAQQPLPKILDETFKEDPLYGYEVGTDGRVHNPLGHEIVAPCHFLSST